MKAVNIGQQKNHKDMRRNCISIRKQRRNNQKFQMTTCGTAETILTTDQMMEKIGETSEV